MLDLKKVTYITGESAAARDVIVEIERLFELDGKCCVLLTPPKTAVGPLSSSGLRYRIHAQLEYKSDKHLAEIIGDRSNFFRVDYVLIDLWGMSLKAASQKIEMIKKLGIPCVAAAEAYHISSGDDETAEYKATTIQGEEMVQSALGFKIYNREVVIQWGGQKATLSSLKSSYVRDRKLDDLLGEDE
jgi:hypothetical protein